MADSPSTAVENRRPIVSATNIEPVPSPLLAKLDRSRLPRHVAIIMDGNGRWAQSRGLPRVEGHRAGVETLKKVVETAGRLGIEILTVYAFSTENWDRPAEEVAFLMNLLEKALREELDQLVRNRIRLSLVGDSSGLPPSIRRGIEQAIRETEANDGLRLNVALNYGGRKEIVTAAIRLAEEVKSGRLEPEAIDQALFARYLYTAGMPDPDLCIRTGGEHRISNFLLWQLAYAELWVTPICWPDFQPDDFYRALIDFQGRQRRFGRV